MLLMSSGCGKAISRYCVSETSRRAMSRHAKKCFPGATRSPASLRKSESILAQNGWTTYGQMIPAAIKVLREDPETLASEQQRARFILIDEFQDCNRGQIDLMALLAGTDRNIFAVGDPDQAIFRFRGATSAAFEEFLGLYPDAHGVVLDENLRSRSPILRCAFALIEENPGITVPTRAGDSFARSMPTSVRDSAQQRATAAHPGISRTRQRCRSE